MITRVKDLKDKCTPDLVTLRHLLENVCFQEVIEPEYCHKYILT